MGSPVDGDDVAAPSPVVVALVAVVSISSGPRRGDGRVDVAPAGMAAFLFGLLRAFTVVRARERLAFVQEPVAEGRRAPGRRRAPGQSPSGVSVHSRSNQRRMRLVPNSAFSPAMASDGPCRAPTGGWPLRKVTSTRPTVSSPNSR